MRWLWGPNNYPVVNVRPDVCLSPGEDINKDTAKARIYEWALRMLVPVNTIRLKELRVERRSNLGMRMSIHGP